MESSPSAPDASTTDAAGAKRKQSTTTKSHEITSRTIKTPAFSYACLELVSDPPIKVPLDDLTVRTYLTSSLTQFLGLTGSAIPVDILKVEPKECWIRIPCEDLSAVVAAVGGWIGRGDGGVQVGWKIRASGNWLGSLVGGRNVEAIWKR